MDRDSPSKDASLGGEFSTHFDNVNDVTNTVLIDTKTGDF